MLVAHLIRELQKMPLDAEVYTEGCDCDGDTYAVTLESDKTIMIQRSENKKVIESSTYKNTEDTPHPHL